MCLQSKLAGQKQQAYKGSVHRGHDVWGSAALRVLRDKASGPQPFELRPLGVSAQACAVRSHPLMASASRCAQAPATGRTTSVAWQAARQLTRYTCRHTSRQEGQAHPKAAVQHGQVTKQTGHTTPKGEHQSCLHRRSY